MSSESEKRILQLVPGPRRFQQRPAMLNDGVNLIRHLR